MCHVYGGKGYNMSSPSWARMRCVAPSELCISVAILTAMSGRLRAECSPSTVMPQMSLQWDIFPMIPFSLYISPDPAANGRRVWFCNTIIIWNSEGKGAQWEEIRVSEESVQVHSSLPFEPQIHWWFWSCCQAWGADK